MENANIAILGIAVIGIAAYLYLNSQNQASGSGAYVAPSTSGNPSYSDAVLLSTSTGSAQTAQPSAIQTSTQTYINPSFPNASAFQTPQMQSALSTVEPGYPLPTLNLQSRSLYSYLPGLFQIPGGLSGAATAAPQPSASSGILNSISNMITGGAPLPSGAGAVSSQSAPSAAPQPPTATDLNLLQPSAASPVSNITSSINTAGGITSAYRAGNTLVYNNANGTVFKLVI